MITKGPNNKPRIRYLTKTGYKTPKTIWCDTEFGITGATKKDLLAHRDRLISYGVTPDMTDEQIGHQILKHISEKGAVKNENTNV